VWSPKERRDNYAGTWVNARIVTGLGNLYRELCRVGPRNARLIYAPDYPLQEFEQWAKLAHGWGRWAPCSIVAEELSEVTRPGKAAPYWHRLVTQGLGWGINLYAVMQRPSESDTTVYGNVSFIHTHYMPRPADRRTIADYMDIDPKLIRELPAYKFLRVGADRRLVRG